ncbi:hypothetical protein [Ensifer sp. 4252]
MDKDFAEQIPIAYAVTYIWGTIGSTIIVAPLGIPKEMNRIVSAVAGC